MTLDEPVELAVYRADWPELFEAEAAVIRRALEDWAIAIEHIGSTAVVGLDAKPIIDIQIGIPADTDTVRISRALVGLGYEAMGEAGVPGRLYFRKRRPRAYNVHVVQLDGQHWKTNLAVRDYLRANKTAAQEYAAAKRQALDGSPTLLEYSRRKAGFMEDLVRRVAQQRRNPPEPREKRP